MGQPVRTMNHLIHATLRADVTWLKLGFWLGAFHETPWALAATKGERSWRLQALDGAGGNGVAWIFKAELGFCKKYALKNRLDIW